MNQTFQYDVFLSHSSKDKPAARELADTIKAGSYFNQTT